MSLSYQQTLNPVRAVHPPDPIQRRSMTVTDKTLGAYQRHEKAITDRGGDVLTLSTGHPSARTDEVTVHVREHFRGRTHSAAVHVSPRELRAALDEFAPVRECPDPEQHNPAHDIDWQTVAEQHEDAIKTLIGERDEARVRTVAAESLTAREHLDAAWEKSHQVDTIPAGVGYVTKWDNGDVEAALEGPRIELPSRGPIFERRLLDPPPAPAWHRAQTIRARREDDHESARWARMDSGRWVCLDGESAGIECAPVDLRDVTVIVEAERDKARAQVGRVRELHQPSDPDDLSACPCSCTCGWWAYDECPTVKALDGT